MSPHDAAPQQVIEQALAQIRRDQQARRLQRQVLADGVSPLTAGGTARFRFLDALDGSGEGKSISDVGEAIGVDRPRASRLTAELLTDGLIERRTHPDDARYTLVRLTENGQGVVEEMHATRRAAVAEALAGFSPEESRAFAELLDRFVSAWPRQRGR